MGLLTAGDGIFAFDDSIEHQKQLKRSAIVQFMNLYKQFKNFTLQDQNKKLFEKYCNGFDFNKDYLKNLWGDEIEMQIIKFDHDKKQVRIYNDNQYLFQDQEEIARKCNFKVIPEYGAWMIETTPTEAYQTGYLLYTLNKGPCPCKDYKHTMYHDVVFDMQNRYESLKKILKKETNMISIPTFIGLGVSDTAVKNNKVTKSLFLEDDWINPHPRFPGLSENIRNRRGEKVEIKVKMFMDKNTNVEKNEKNPFPGYIYMDAMGFGMGSCCLQVTYSSIDFKKACWLYDQLAVFSPLLLSLTAGSPAFRGYLADVDNRWDIIAASVDCRTKEERDPQNQQNQKYIPKPRYDSISYYISCDERNLDSYSDIYFPLNQEVYDFAKQRASEMGLEISERFIRHLGFLFIRDAMVIFKDRVELDNESSTEHFENIQSTNWNSVRLKPPPSMNTNIGWRVELRTMELLLTPQENAAFSILSQLLVQMIQSSLVQLNFYIPISKVDENFMRAKQKGSILNQKFHFRVNVYESGDAQIKELTMYEIFFGCNEFQGLHELYNSYHQTFVQNFQPSNDDTDQQMVQKIFGYIKQLCSGQRKTLAQYQRDFIMTHQDYQQDSVVSESIQYDLYKKLVEIQNGNLKDDNFQTIF